MPQPPGTARARWSFSSSVWVIAIVAFYTWTPAPFESRWLFDAPVSFYHELTDGFLSGRTHLLRVPDRELVSLADPYDPKANEAFRINDLSYHGGRYYLYHSAVPALVIFNPVKLLLGQYLSPTIAVLIFSLIGALASLYGLLIFRASFARHSSRIAISCAFVAMTLSQGYAVIVRGGTVNQVPISAAYGFLMLSLVALLRAILSKGQNLVWAAISSLGMGLAIAARPNYIFAGAMLVVPMIAFVRKEQRFTIWPFIRLVLATTAPCCVVLLALFSYNYLRFSNPLEFGARLMMGAWDQRNLPPLNFAGFSSNVYTYFASPGNYHNHFPYVTAPSWQAIGLLWHAPFIWLILLVPMALRSCRAARPFIVAVMIVAAANSLVLLLIPSGNASAVVTSANVRYLLDFQPSLVTLACSVTLLVSHTLVARRQLRRLLDVTTVGLTLASVIASLSLDLERYPPESYRSAARYLSQPTWWWERLTGVTYGPVGLDVTLPRGKTGTYEPLLAVGTSNAGDVVYLHYESANSVRVGLVGVGAPGPITEPIRVDYSKSHRIEVSLGSLYPPIAHPDLSRFSAGQIAVVKRQIEVRIDGNTVLKTPAYFNPTTSHTLEVAKTSFLTDYCAPTFTGNLLGFARLPLNPPTEESLNPPRYGPFRIKVRFPKGANNQNQPLVTSGIPQAGDVLYVSYSEDKAIRLALDHWGHKGASTDWLPIDFDQDHVLGISYGALYPTNEHPLLSKLSVADRSRLKDRIKITLDDRIILDVPQSTYDSSPYDVTVGRNIIGSSSCGYLFTGEVRFATRQALTAEPATDGDAKTTPIRSFLVPK